MSFVILLGLDFDFMYANELMKVITCTEQIIDEDTQAKLKILGRCLPAHDVLQAKCRMDSSWGFFRNHLFCHLVYAKRKRRSMQAGHTVRGGVKRDDLIPHVPLDNPPHFNWNAV